MNTSVKSIAISTFTAIALATPLTSLAALALNSGVSSSGTTLAAGSIDPFWTISTAGVKAAAKEFNVTADVLMPPKGIGDQKRMIETAKEFSFPVRFTNVF